MFMHRAIYRLNMANQPSYVNSRYSDEGLFLLHVIPKYYLNRWLSDTCSLFE